MPGLDAVEARARGERVGRRYATHRRAEAVATAMTAVLLLALIPSQTGAIPREADAASELASPPASLAAVDRPALAVDATASATASATAAPSQPPTARPSPTAAVAVVDVPAGPIAYPEAETAAVAEPTATPKPRVKPAVVPAASTATPSPAPTPGEVRQAYKKDLYHAAGVRYQNPDYTACTAAATEVMLNFIAARGTPDAGFAWAPTTSYDTQEAILSWERAHDTLDDGPPGSDPHGWRNALNNFGWGDFTTPGSRHYEDLSYGSYEAAIRAAVVAIARENQPVGILGWAGGHAQIMTGYEVYGLDPAVSSDFAVQAVYLTDPLASDHILDARIAYSDFASGSTTYRFTPYNWRDSAADDPYTPGTIRSDQEWFGKWVIIAPMSTQSATPGASH
jgi:hypothetical protein